MGLEKSKIIVIWSLVIGVSFVFVMSILSNTLSLDDEGYKFDSLVYDIGDNYIENISPYTSVELYKKYLELDKCAIEVVNNGDKLLDSDYVVNGSKTLIYNEENALIKTVTNVIKGDFTNDGIVDNKDLEDIGKCLVDSCVLEEYQVNSLDIDDDLEVHMNDLMLLDKAITLGYTDVSFEKEEMTIRLDEDGQLVPSITPNYGLNQNLKWSSDNSDIVTVDEVGRIVAVGGGETVIKATTQDDSIESQVKVVVDNSIKLDSYEGNVYINGDDVRVHIDLVKYEGIECSSDNNTVASCSIDGEYLVIKGNSSGTTSIRVKGDRYKEAVYKITSIPVYISYIQYRAGCNIAYSMISTTNAMPLIFESDNPEVLKGAHLQKYGTSDILVFDYGEKGGTATLKVKASTNGMYKEILIDHSIMKLKDMYTFTKVGEEVSTEILGENLKTLSCSVPETESSPRIVDCRIEDNKLIVTPLAVGNVIVTVYNKTVYDGGWPGDCGSAQFSVFIQE